MAIGSELRPATPSKLSKGARTRLRILDAAAHVLRRQGYAGTRLSDIAEVAGLQTGSLAFHFPSKDELLHEVLRHGLAEGLARVRDAVGALGPDAPAAARVTAAMHAHLDGLDDANDYAPALLRSLAQFPAAERHRLGDLDHEYVACWRDLLADAQRAGAVGSGPDPALLARLLLGAMNAVLGLPALASREQLVAALLLMLGLPEPAANPRDGEAVNGEE